MFGGHWDAALAEVDRALGELGDRDAETAARLEVFRAGMVANDPRRIDDFERDRARLNRLADGDGRAAGLMAALLASCAVCRIEPAADVAALAMRGLDGSRLMSGEDADAWGPQAAGALAYLGEFDQRAGGGRRDALGGAQARLGVRLRPGVRAARARRGPARRPARGRGRSALGVRARPRQRADVRRAAAAALVDRGAGRAAAARRHRRGRRADRPRPRARRRILRRLAAGGARPAAPAARRVRRQRAPTWPVRRGDDPAAHDEPDRVRLALRARPRAAAGRARRCTPAGRRRTATWPR